MSDAKSVFPAPISMRRSDLDKILGLKGAATSYRFFRTCRQHGIILMSDIIRVFNQAARNGATFDPAVDLGQLVKRTEMSKITGLAYDAFRRQFRKWPHFFISQKLVYFKRSDILKFI